METSDCMGAEGVNNQAPVVFIQSPSGNLGPKETEAVKLAWMEWAAHSEASQIRVRDGFGLRDLRTRSPIPWLLLLTSTSPE